ncbi:MAG: hypothetical protein D6677_01060 [Calditrichaeota bacterium]|nr:MAG: hypothetical protein D6677_01060 [Calditrichota bacterium]
MKKSQIIILLTLIMLSFIAPGQAQIIVKVKPVKPKVVVVKPAPPAAGYVWVEGHWVVKNKQYVWKKGHWVKAKKHHRYVNGHWKRARGGWVWIPGRWRKV